MNISCPQGWEPSTKWKCQAPCSKSRRKKYFPFFSWCLNLSWFLCYLKYINLSGWMWTLTGTRGSLAPPPPPIHAKPPTLGQGKLHLLGSIGGRVKVGCQSLLWREWWEVAGPPQAEAPNFWLILHCPIVLHLQNRNSKIKLLSTWRWQLQSLEP